jgi:hypothetical protein
MATDFTELQMSNAKMKDYHLDPVKKPGKGMIHMVKRNINFDNLATNSGQAVALDDTYPIATLRKGDIVIAAGVNVLTATTAACVFDLGGTDVDGLVDGVVGDAATAEQVKAARGVLLPMYVVTAAGEDISLSATIASPAGGEVEAWMLIFRGGEE